MKEEWDHMQILIEDSVAYIATLEEESKKLTDAG